MATINTLDAKSIGHRERPDYSPKVQNTISTADLRQPVKIQRLNDYRWGRFDTEDNYNGKVGYVKDDKMQGRVTVFESGKLISTGAKSVSHSFWQLTRTMDLLAKNRFVKRVVLEPELRNIVGTVDVRVKLDINRMAQALPKSIFEPEQFPGVIHKTSTGTVLVFASGKMVIAGAKTEAELESLAKHMSELAKTYHI